ncbi:MAG: hypothetical protein UX13_C0003G0004 [Candidatus Woesebacteria bacterium GW2011_GWB1_45_5]|uniref:Uncharacterized protein n=1 Tax=Candidatus Woesebacteria bacterium GW2011_GWB1_45_5 TaxID=1618581 RepID=A0A0G1MRN3_9BACT|nr:MAG: hypothetical protein UX13_C0003G0004 [Candidatus Woesebacteria bacterium GW2011_GWB1_45_5]
MMNSNGRFPVQMLAVVVVAAVVGAILFSAWTVFSGGQGIGQQLCNQYSSTGQFLGQVPCSALPFQAAGPTVAGTQIPSVQTGPTTNSGLKFVVNDFKTNSGIDANLLLYQYNPPTPIGQILPAESAWSGLAEEITKSTSDTFSNITGNTGYTAVIGNTTGTFTFYPTLVHGVSPNTSTVTVPILVRQAATSAATTTVYGDDDITAVTLAAKQSLAVNGFSKFRIRIQPASSTNNNLFFSDNVLGPATVFDFNSVTIKSLTDLIEKGPLGQANMVPIGSAPAGHQIGDLERTTSIAYQMGMHKTLVPGQTYDITGTINAGSTEPTTTDDASDINVTIYDGCLIRNSTTGAWVEAYRDPVSLANSCATNITDAIHIS